jgi:PAS domain S-box-containing protein
MRVLVVDDDPAGRYLLQSIIESGGHEVVCAVDGEEALRLAQESLPDIAISDILMPKMDGYQLCRAWKADDALTAVPIVFYTASYTDLADERFASSLGVDGFWRKPMDPTSLLRGIQDLVGNDGAVRRPDLVDETEVLQEYSQRLVNKLEEKAASLERANAELKRAMEILGEEVSVKANLIAELSADVIERKRVERALRDERDFTRQVIEVADLLICVVDTAGKVLLFSHGAERITGWTAEEAIGTLFSDAFLSDEYAGAFEHWLKAAAAEGALSTEFEVACRDGGRRVLRAALSVASDDDGVPLSHSIFASDVTDHIRDEIAEAIVADLDRMVIRDAPEAEILKSLCETTSERYNLPVTWVGLVEEGVLEIVACSGPEAAYIGPPGLRLTEADDSWASVEVMKTGLPVFRRGDEILHRPGVDAERFGIGAEIVLPLATNEGIIGILALYSKWEGRFDAASEQRLHRLATRTAASIMASRSREQVRIQSAALISAADAVAITDASGRVRWSNPAFESLSGHAAVNSHGLDLLTLSATGDDSDRFAAGMAVAREGRIWRAEVVWARKDGGRIRVEVTIAPVLATTEGEARFVIVAQDITERRRIDELRSGFIAMVSHELRTPLTSIIGYTDLLAQMPEPQLVSQSGPVLSKLRVNGLKMKQLVEELLEVTTMQYEGVGVNLRPIDLEDVVRLAADSVDRPPDHTLVVSVADEMPEVPCDPERINRAVANLVSNAFKYSPDGGPVTVSVAVEGDEATIAVEDKGVGLAPEDLPRLFDRFTQGDMSTTRRFGGMGLGLFIADQFVKAHGGRIEVTSSLGKGSEFKIYLPLER